MLIVSPPHTSELFSLSQKPKRKQCLVTIKYEKVSGQKIIFYHKYVILQTKIYYLPIDESSQKYCQECTTYRNGDLDSSEIINK